MELWNTVVDEFVHGEAAPADFFRADVDRVALIRRALKLPGGNNRAAAVALLRRMSPEEGQRLFPELIQLARSAHGPIGAVREIIFSLPQEWVLERIDAQVEPILRNEEYDDYWMFLEIYEKLDSVRAVKLARRAAGSTDSAIRELGLERLARFVVAAATDTAEGEAYRAALGPMWQGTAKHQRDRLRGLSEDLCALAEGGSRVIPMSPKDAAAWQAEARVINDAVQLGLELDEALAFLRQPHPPLLPPADFIPYLQGLCWEQLGDDETALVFYQEAARRNAKHAIVLINILVKLHRFKEAAEMSESVIRSADAGPEELYDATLPLRALTQESSPDEAKILLEKVINTLRRAINLVEKGAGSAPQDQLRSKISFVLAVCLQKLGRVDEAGQTLDAAIANAPQDPDLLVYRGNLRSATDPTGALADFKAAIRYGTASFWPFFYLSRHALRKGGWEEALTLANRAVASGAVPLALAEAYEGIAIAQSNLGFPLEKVVENFDRAVALAPENERIRQNREVVAQRMRNKPQARADWQGEFRQREGDSWDSMLEEHARLPSRSPDFKDEPLVGTSAP